MEIGENLRAWDKGHDWSRQGDEWSDSWGGPENQWYWSLYPRIHKYIPCDTILEIAPGFGRWTQFLYNLCKRLIIVDLSPKCIMYCKERFNHCKNIEYVVNDGRSLEMIGSNSIDFVFSFDSLVHADDDAISGYIPEISRVLNAGGVAFVHHSNLADAGPVKNTQCRADMSAKKVKAYIEANGLSCIGQETLNWGGEAQIDCLTIFGKRDGRCVLIMNDQYCKEADYIRFLSGIY
jgi:2-polyprenyl-3-methyl-5-hydroxy-6-metoxy-1,4-benzoquinol methylase